MTATCIHLHNSSPEIDCTPITPPIGMPPTNQDNVNHVSDRLSMQITSVSISKDRGLEKGR